MKPRSTICWECGLRLYQRKSHTEMVVDGHPRILHKQCAKSIKKGDRSEFISRQELIDSMNDDRIDGYEREA